MRVARLLAHADGRRVIAVDVALLDARSADKNAGACGCREDELFHITVLVRSRAQVELRDFRVAAPDAELGRQVIPYCSTGRDHDVEIADAVLGSNGAFDRPAPF